MPDSAIMDRRKWLLRLIYVRVVVFTLFVAGEITRGQTQTLADLQTLLFVVYGLSVAWLLVLRIIPSTFLLNFLSYTASVAGLFTGLVGVVYYVRLNRNKRP